MATPFPFLQRLQTQLGEYFRPELPQVKNFDLQKYVPKDVVPSIGRTIKGLLSAGVRGVEGGLNKLFPEETINIGNPPPQAPSTIVPVSPLPSIQPEIESATPSPTVSDLLARNPAVTNFQISPIVEEAIRRASIKYGVPPSLLYDIALQESSFNPTADPFAEGRGTEYAEAGYPRGLFQITQPTLRDLMNYGTMPGNTLELSNTDLFDPYTNALMAAYLISKGQLGRWDASKGVWGPFYSEEELEPYYRQTPGR